MMAAGARPIRCKGELPGEAALSSIPLTAAITVIWIALFASATPAFAYIDPGSGGMMMQLLLGGVAGVAVLVRLYWQRFTTFIGVRKAGAESRERTGR
jgi:hypothetical protein